MMTDASTTRGREWDDAKCDELATFDASRDPKEFLPHIYREATNGNQHPANQVAKTLAKCSALLVHLAAKQERIHRGIRALTVVLVLLTVVLAALTALLYYETRLGNQAPQLHQQAPPQHP
jgi:type VI protein secretion system component VasF